MKIAIISDIHGNLEALKQTIEDIEKRKVDKIFCLGDIIAKGVHPEECVKLIKEKCEIVLRGNFDRHYSDKNRDINQLEGVQKERFIFNKTHTTEESRDYLFNLPYSYEFYMSGSLIRLFHATPKKDNIAIINNDKIKDKYEMFMPSENTISQKTADIVVYGHIHHQYMDKLYNKTLINVGSVGNSFDVIRNDKKDSNVKETLCSQYLIIEGNYQDEEYNEDLSFSFIRVQYDLERELKDVYISNEKETYLYEMKNALYRNMEKINENFERLGINPNEF